MRISSHRGKFLTELNPASFINFLDVVKTNAKMREVSATRMHISGKVLLAIGSVIILIGIVLMVLGGSSGAESFEEAGQFVVESGTSGAVEVLDKDGEGDLGFTFWVKGEYVDDDGDGYWDHCNETGNITVITHPEVNDDWAGEHNGSFYHEVMPEQGCEAAAENKELIRAGEGFIKVGRACLACHAGTFEFESQTPVWVSYDDVALEALFTGLGEFVGGIFGGGALLCCGGLLAIVGIILGLTLKTEDAHATTYTSQIPVHPSEQAAPPSAVQTPGHGGPPNQGQW